MDDTTLIQSVWTLTCAALVLFMQAGFCALEAGSVRHKNSINVALKNIVDLCGSFAAYFVIGYALMFGVDTGRGLIGQPSFFLSGLDDGKMLTFLFQVTFCSTAATIVSGGVAERCRFLPYLLMSIAIGVLIYPDFGHWVWGPGGWLSEMGYHDFAGSSVVHMVGAGVALAGIQVLGPRNGRFNEDGSSRRIPASNMPTVAIGVFILTFGWIGFNGGSAALGVETPTIVVNTLLAACFGGLFALLGTWAYGGLAAVEVILNGVLGGLVAITACANVVDPASAAVIGLLGGLAVVIGTDLMERLKLDDAVGAVPVHGLAGVVGILVTPLFMTDAAFAATGSSLLRLIGVQALGAGACLLWSYLVGRVLWSVVGRITQLRIGPFEEQVGLNYSEHKVDDAIQDLTTAVSMAASGSSRDDLQRRLEQASSSEVAQLAAAIRALLQRTDRMITQMRSFRHDLRDVQASFQDHHSQGDAAVQRCHEALQRVRSSADNLLAWVEERREADRSMALLADLARSFRQGLDEMQEALPAATGAWQTVQRHAETLQRMLRSVQGVTR